MEQLVDAVASTLHMKNTVCILCDHTM